ncbi:hypothetical protein D9M68_820290 [compost metagenome]
MDQRAVGEAGLFGHGVPAFKHRDFVAIECQFVGGGDADDAGPDDRQLHGSLRRGSARRTDGWFRDGTVKRGGGMGLGTKNSRLCWHGRSWAGLGEGGSVGPAAIIDRLCHPMGLNIHSGLCSKANRKPAQPGVAEGCGSA